jgi:ABC-type multidrug transport system ATPase subunit
VDDGAKTKLEDKGTGMQRAVALAIIQVYAQSVAVHPDDPKKSRPLFFFIDEPEICLHPKAQYQLLDALIEIAKVRQIFISTHSPYFLKRFSAKNHKLLVFARNGTDVKVTPGDALTLFNWSPSLGEINHRAYQLYTVEFHNELYGHIQEKEGQFNESDMEAFLVSKGNKQSKNWVRIKNGQAQNGRAVTLMTFIRNTIHHPENRQNADYSDQELKDSIEAMIKLA